MPFVKGQSGNPGGGKKNSWKAQLQRAIIKEGENIGETPFEHAAKLFFTSRDACIGMMNFFIPKLRTIEAKLDAESPFRLIIALPEPKQLDKQIEGTEALQDVSQPFTKTITVEPVNVADVI